MRAARFAIGLSVLCLAACNLNLFATPPVEYVAVTTVTGDRGALHARAGVYYTLANVDSRQIVSLQIAFDLYDAESQPVPGQGANSFYTDVEASLASGATVQFVTSLDEVFSAVPESLSVGRFRVASARLEDGATWTNTGGYVYEAAE